MQDPGVPNDKLQKKSTNEKTNSLSVHKINIPVGASVAKGKQSHVYQSGSIDDPLPLCTAQSWILLRQPLTVFTLKFYLGGLWDASTTVLYNIQPLELAW